MFQGKHTHNVDSKGRITVPASFRDGLGNRFVITRGLDTCLTIYPHERWEELSDRLQKLSSMKKEVRQLVRFIIGGSSELECDKQGRVLIPGYLREYAGIKRDAILLGIGNQIEIWSKELLSKQEADTLESVSDIAASLDLPLDFSL